MAALTFQQATGLDGSSLVSAGDVLYQEAATRLLPPTPPRSDYPNRTWSLLPQDERLLLDPRLQIYSQFRPTNVRFSYANELGEAISVNADDAVLEYVRGTVDTITFDALFYGDVSGTDQVPNTPGFVLTSRGKDLKYPVRMLEALRTAVKKNQKLQRPPIYLWTAGADLAFLCFVHRVDGEVLDFREDGTLRGFRATLTLKHYTPIDQSSLTQSEAVDTGDLIVVDQPGIDWELLGYLESGAVGVGQIYENFNTFYATTTDGAPLVPGAEVQRPPNKLLSDAANGPVSLALGSEGAATAFDDGLLQTGAAVLGL